MFKLCPKCGIEKSFSEFHKSKNRKDGLHTYCKSCRREIYYDTIEERKKYNIVYYQKNKDKLKEYSKIQGRKYYNINKYRINKKGKEHSKDYYPLPAIYITFAHQINFCEEVCKDPNDTKLLQVRCTENNCRKWFNPTNLQMQNRISCISRNKEGESRFYCSDECKERCPIYFQQSYPKGFKKNNNRDLQSEWAELVKERDNYTCQRCGNIFDLITHHIEGLNENPIESADIDIGITLCKGCHKFAHKDIGCRYVDLQKQNLCKEKK